jgi:hypothetical protein
VADTKFAVSEPIGLELVDSNNGGYLGAQLFAGCMYLAAAISMLLLRAWKIGELEQLAAVKDLPVGTVDPTMQEPEPGTREREEMAKQRKSNLMKRFWILKKV